VRCSRGLSAVFIGGSMFQAGVTTQPTIPDSRRTARKKLRRYNFYIARHGTKYKPRPSA
jgi:hypothetical protein